MRILWHSVAFGGPCFPHFYDRRPTTLPHTLLQNDQPRRRATQQRLPLDDRATTNAFAHDQFRDVRTTTGIIVRRVLTPNTRSVFQ